MLNRRDFVSVARELIQYHRHAPATDPIVPAKTTARNMRSPLAASYPANGMISSDGIGGKIFSKIISAATPKLPMAVSQCVIKSNMLPPFERASTWLGSTAW